MINKKPITITLRWKLQMIEFKNWPKFWAPGYIWTIGLDWDVSCWWRVYSHDYYDGDWYSYRLGPLYFGRYV